MGWPLRASGATASPRRLTLPPLLDTRATGRMSLAAMTGSMDFLGQGGSVTAGYNQAYLGPTVIVQNGPLRAEVGNGMSEPVTAHWHGLMVPGEHDGGPHLLVPPGERWRPDITIQQAPTTAWYHTHVHGRTAAQVYAGLAGIIHVSDGRDDDRRLPSDYGNDDLTLVLQDRRFDAAGRMTYDPGMIDLMHGFAGTKMLVNGQVGAVAAVPKAIVRLRLLNGSNGRIYSLFLDDGRPMHLVATDGGYLPFPIELDVLRLAPGERAEILVDFREGSAPILMSGSSETFGVLEFGVDETATGRITKLPDQLGPAPASLGQDGIRTRRFSLDMGMGQMMMGARGGGFAINGRPFDMGRIDFEVPLGSVERWIVASTMVAHPFHVHGVQFQVVSENGAPPRPENTGWKDTVLVPGETELLVRFDQPASRDRPFMYHCHILEHEDAGMMGQFSVA